MSTRITIRLDDDLYARLLLFAQGRNGQTPEVSRIVREALEQYLTPKVRQTGRLGTTRHLSDTLPTNTTVPVRHHKGDNPR